MMSEEKFVIFPAGALQCAVSASCVSELSLPQEVYSFPHTSREILGVILRRGKVIPLYDLAGMLKLPEYAPAHYHLIAVRHVADSTELAAIPVSGECDLVSGEVVSAKNPAPGVVGELIWESRSYELLDLDKLIAASSAE
jgi:chemotaxis signal transduction protein